MMQIKVDWYILLAETPFYEQARGTSAQVKQKSVQDVLFAEGLHLSHSLRSSREAATICNTRAGSSINQDSPAMLSSSTGTP